MTQLYRIDELCTSGWQQQDDDTINLTKEQATKAQDLIDEGCTILTDSALSQSLELPSDFPHSPPDNYKYKVIRKNSSLLSIWTVYQREFIYNNGDESACIWGFYNPKKREYYAPINSTKVGDKVDINLQLHIHQCN